MLSSPYSTLNDRGIGGPSVQSCVYLEGHLFHTDGDSMSALLNVILLFIMKTTQGIAGARVYVRMRIAHLPVKTAG